MVNAFIAVVVNIPDYIHRMASVDDGHTNTGIIIYAIKPAENIYITLSILLLLYSNKSSSLGLSKK